MKAIRSIAARRKIDLVGMLRERFGLTTADELGIRQTSNLIGELKGDEGSSPGSNGNGIHSAIEQHVQSILSGEEQPDVERLMTADEIAEHHERTRRGETYFGPRPTRPNAARWQAITRITEGQTRIFSSRTGPAAE